MELLISIIIGVLIMEAYSWLPFLCNWLLEKAILRLREQDQERCREEWSAALTRLPNTLVRLVHTISFFPSARHINNDSFEFEEGELSAELKEVIVRHAQLFKYFTDRKTDMLGSKCIYRERLDELVSTTKTFALEATKKGLVADKLVASTEGFSQTVFGACSRATNLHIVCMDQGVHRLSDIKQMIGKIATKLNSINERRKQLSLDEHDALLLGVTAELRAVKDIFADKNWGDDKALDESTRIFKAIHDASRRVATMDPDKVPTTIRAH